MAVKLYHLPNGINCNIMVCMDATDATVTLDKAGRMVLPKPLRDQLHLAPGDTLTVSLEGDRITLCPRRACPPLQRERSVWVFRNGEPLTAADVRNTLRGLREHRAGHNSGDPR